MGVIGFDLYDNDVACDVVACRAKRKKLTRKMQKIPFGTPKNDIPNGIFI